MRRFGIFALVASLIGCDKTPIEWSDVTYSEAISETRSAVPAITPSDSAGCRRTARTLTVGTQKHGIWWTVRSDSSAILRYALLADSGNAVPVSVDTTDRSRRGCDRPAPALAADEEGRVYAAYFLEPASGPGIFFVHKMDSIGFHDPISIAYGKRPSVVSLDVAGDRIAVAYEEPNSARGQIWVALSATMGHLFEFRGPVSASSEISRLPEARLNGTKLDISWAELIQSDSHGRSRRAQRSGIWK
jgi:hypothetical protein